MGLVGPPGLGDDLSHGFPSEATRLAWNGFTRASVLILGGIVTLQSSSSLDLTKLAYLVVATICVSGSIVVVAGRRHSDAVAALRPFLVASLGIAVLVALSLPIAYSHGTPLTSWLRDGATYLLVASVPFVALDLYWSATPRSMLALLLVAGVASTASYAVVWLDARGILALPIDRLTLPSGELTSALFVVLIAMSMAGGRRWMLWAVALGLDMALFVLIGGRGRMVLLGLPVVVAVLARPLAARRLLAALALPAMTAVVAFAAMHAFISPVSIGPPISGDGSTPPSSRPSSSTRPTATANPIDNRIGSLPAVVADVGADQSVQERVAQTKAAWRIFVASPILGAAPGRSIEWVNSQGRTVSSYNLDTPLMVASKFGIFGVLSVAAWMLWILAFAWDLTRRAVMSWVVLAFGAYALVILYGWIFVPPLEDKGLSFALIIFLALGLGARSSRIRPGPLATA